MTKRERHLAAWGCFQAYLALSGHQWDRAGALTMTAYALSTQHGRRRLR